MTSLMTREVNSTTYDNRNLVGPHDDTCSANALAVQEDIGRKVTHNYV
jgi:hypothetical protein